MIAAPMPHPQSDELQQKHLQLAVARYGTVRMKGEDAELMGVETVQLPGVLPKLVRRDGVWWHVLTRR